MPCLSTLTASVIRFGSSVVTTSSHFKAKRSTQEKGKERLKCWDKRISLEKVALEMNRYVLGGAADVHAPIEDKASPRPTQTRHGLVHYSSAAWAWHIYACVPLCHLRRSLLCFFLLTSCTHSSCITHKHLPISTSLLEAWKCGITQPVLHTDGPYIFRENNKYIFFVWMFFLCAKAHIKIVNTTNPTQKWTKKVNSSQYNNGKQSTKGNIHMLLPPATQK